MARMTERDAPGPGHETRDVNVRGVSIFGGVLAAVVLVVLGLMVWMFNSLASREAARAPALSARSLTAPGPRGAAVQLPPEPRLQSDPAGDLARLRAEEEAQLDGYAWVDRQHGVVRIPVERAMEIVVRKGLK